MKKQLLILLCISLLSASFAQPVLKPSIGIGGIPSDADAVCPIPFYLGGSAASGYHKGDTVADFTLYNLKGDSLNLFTALSSGKPTLLISGSFTCPITRGKIASINNIVSTYGSQINVYLIYIVEVHPAIDSSPYFAAVNTNPVNIAAGILYRQPTTYGERKAMVARFQDSLHLLAPVFIDGPCNNWWLKYGPAQNNATLIDANGIVFAKHAWYDRPPDHMICDIDSLLGNPVSCQPVGSFNYNLLSTDTAYGNSGDTISFNGTLVNSSAHNVKVLVARRSNGITPLNWTSAICFDACNSSVTDTISFVLTPGTTKPFRFNFYTKDGSNDTGYVRLRFWNDGDQGNKFNQNFCGITTIVYPPSVFTVSGPAGFCRASGNNIYSVSPVQSKVSYNWTFPAGATIVSGQGTGIVTVDYSATAIAGIINVTASNSRGTANSVKSIVLRSSNSAVPGVIVGSNVGCNGDVKTYAIRKIGNADYYIWTPPLGTTVNGSDKPLITPDTNVVVAYSVSFTGDTLRVRSVNCSGGSAERKLRINRTLAVTPGPITGTTLGLCNQVNKTYTIKAVANAVSYTWRTNIVGAFINGSVGPVTTSNLSVIVDFGSFVSGQVFVKSNNNCGSSGERSLTLSAKPPVPASITGPASVCTGQSDVGYLTNVIDNVTAYNWAMPSGSFVTSGQNTNLITARFGSLPITGNIRVRSQNNCATSAFYNLSVAVNNCVRLSDEPISKRLFLKPNPFNSSATLVLPDGTDLNESEIVIYNIVGVEQRSIRNLNDYTIELQKENLPVGIYVLQLFIQKTLIGSVKMIIE